MTKEQLIERILKLQTNGESLNSIEDHYIPDLVITHHRSHDLGMTDWIAFKLHTDSWDKFLDLVLENYTFKD